MITAETITDAQIRELRDSLSVFVDPPLGFECPGGRVSDLVATCDAALKLYGADPKQIRRAARARLAAILNARTKEQR